MRLASLVALFLMALPIAAQAQGFFVGKTLTILIPSNPGGGIDAYSRLVARHLGRQIEGQPSVTVQNVPGAGGLRALNLMVSRMSQDGTVILNVNSGNLIHELMGEPGMDVSLRKLQWLGDLSQSNPVDLTWPHSKIKTLDDAKKYVTRVGATGVGSSPAQIAWAFNALVGTKYQVILGYTGAGEYELAVQRGELDGRNVTSYTSYMAGVPEDVRPRLNLLAQLGMRKDPNVPADVPLLADLVKGDPVKEATARLLALCFASINRPFAVAPNVPAERVTILQRAFADMLRDPQFLEDARRMGADISPTSGTQLSSYVSEALSFPAEIVATLKEAVREPKQ
jgi:tripartite-type tricarboxylate transporter receptor subunit TctC